MGRPKQTLMAGGMTLLDRVLEEALNSELDTIVLLLGSRAEEIKNELQTDIHHPKLRMITNKRHRHGISTSIIAGLSDVEEVHDHVMILLADMPFITSALINKLLRGYLDSALPLGAIAVQGRRSHPVIINRKFYCELHQLQGDTGARDLFLRHRNQVCLIDPVEEYKDIDIDTPNEFLNFKRGLGEKGVGGTRRKATDLHDGSSDPPTKSEEGPV